MNIKNNSLADLTIDQKAIVKSIKSTGTMRRRLQDLGIIEGTKIKCVLKSPFGDPSAYEIRGAVVALRSEIASEIKIEYTVGDNILQK